MKKPNMKYSICFILYKEKVLMLKRKFEPWINRWNGVGGKIEPKETSREAVIREVMEETGIDLHTAEYLRPAGIVTWDAKVEDDDNADDLKNGMYVFVAKMRDSFRIWEGEKQIPEGWLAWKRLNWVTDVKNHEVALNVAHFLPDMLKNAEEHEYYCVFEGKEFRRVEILKS